MNNILINPKTGAEYENVPVRVAAEFLSTSPQAVRDGILGKTLPIGAVALNAGGKPRFIIPPERLKSWKNGYDLNISAAEKLLEKIKITAQVTADESH